MREPFWSLLDTTKFCRARSFKFNMMHYASSLALSAFRSARMLWVGCKFNSGFYLCASVDLELYCTTAVTRTQQRLSWDTISSLNALRTLTAGEDNMNSQLSYDERLFFLVSHFAILPHLFAFVFICIYTCSRVEAAAQCPFYLFCLFRMQKKKKKKNEILVLFS